MAIIVLLALSFYHPLFKLAALKKNYRLLQFTMKRDIDMNVNI